MEPSEPRLLLALAKLSGWTVLAILAMTLQASPPSGVGTYLDAASIQENMEDRV